ncbi:MAG: MATE family efflux transporter [Bacteroidales bacterium]|nr:MATE family efflux transporter [Bacteroidales bacterium]
MNRRILGLALPNIITNITVPLLGMVDMAIVGHLSSSHLGAIAIGTQIFNLIYWNFGFLRMGTSGFTAQAYGAQDMREAVRIFVRAITIAIAVAFLLLLLQWPISRLSLLIFNVREGKDVLKLAMAYFFVRIWAAPATLGLYAVKGWFIGMQNAKLPMWIAIFLNTVNIACSLLFVLVLEWDIRGVALGTVIAQYSGLAVGLFFMVKKYGWVFYAYGASFKTVLGDALHWKEMRRFFAVNGDIFLRTVCLATVFTFITAASGRISKEILAIDALLMQFFTLFSYIMDGFAYAGESLVGRYIGARDSRSLRLSVRLLLVWGLALTILFTGLYALGGEWFLRLFSNDAAVISGAKVYMFWTLIIPVCGFAAFLFDGIFVGATASRAMLGSMLVATAAFFAVYYGGKSLFLGSPTSHNTNLMLWNNILWTAFMVYLALRGIVQALCLKKSVYETIEKQK